MNLVANRSVSAEQEVMDMPSALARWYAAHSSIRRLRAVEDRLATIVFVALEPTSDGNDSLPVWLANRHVWANDLRLLTQRDVQLKLIVPDAEEPCVNTDTVTIAELSWRDSWVAP